MLTAQLVPLIVNNSTMLATSLVKSATVYQPEAEEVVDMRGGSAELTQTYFYSLVR